MPAPRNDKPTVEGNRAGLLRDGALLGLGQVLAALGGLVGLKVLTSVIEPDVFGQVALLLGLAALGQNFLCLPVLLAALRFYPEAQQAGRIATLRRILGRVLTGGILLTAFILIVGGFFWSRWHPEGLPLLGFVAVSLLLASEVLQALETGLLNAARQQGRFSRWIVLSAWLRPLCGAGLVLLLGGGAPTVLFGFALGMVLTYAGFRGTAIRGDPQTEPDPDWSAKTRAGILRYAAPLVPMALLAWTMNMGDRYVLASWTDTATVGVYAAVYGLASQPFTMIAGVVHNTFRPRLFDAVVHGDHAEERRIFKLFLAVMVGATGAGVVGITLTSEWLTHLLLGPRFWGAADLMPWIAGAFAVQGIQQVFETELYAQKRTHLLVFVHGGAAVVALALYLVLIPDMGAKGAALGTLLAMTGSCALAFWLSGAGPRLLLRVDKPA